MPMKAATKAAPVQANAPRVVQINTPRTANTSRTSGCSLNRNFVVSPLGILNMALIIFLLGGIISIACVPKLTYFYDPRTDTETGYLIFACIGFVLEIAYFLLQAINAIADRLLNKVPVDFVLAVNDLIFGIALFGLAISCAVQESVASLSYYFNKGSFAAASIFGFCTAILYCAHFVFCVIEIKRGRTYKC